MPGGRSVLLWPNQTNRVFWDILVISLKRAISSFCTSFSSQTKKLPRFYTTDAKMANSGSRLGQMPPAFAGPNFADCLDSHSVYGRELGDGVVDLVLAKREYFAHHVIS